MASENKKCITTRSRCHRAYHNLNAIDLCADHDLLRHFLFVCKAQYLGCTSSLFSCLDWFCGSVCVLRTNLCVNKHHI